MERNNFEKLRSSHACELHKLKTVHNLETKNNLYVENMKFLHGTQKHHFFTSQQQSQYKRQKPVGTKVHYNNLFSVDSIT